MEKADDVPPIGLGTLLRAVLAQLEPAVEQSYSAADPRLRSRYYPILRHLLIHEQASVGQIAAAVGVSQPAITQTIRQMADVDLLDVRPGADRRARNVRLSAAGLDMVERLRPVWRAVSAAAAGLERDSGQPIFAALEAVLDALSRQDFANRIAQEKGTDT